MPLFAPFLLLIEAIRALFYIFPLWLAGYWWCDDCGERYGTEDEKVYMQYGDICLKCNKNH